MRNEINNEMTTTDFTAKLKVVMQKTLDTCKKTNVVIELKDVNYIFDEILHDFMKKNFCYEYEENETAMNLYSNFGCDIRFDFECELKDFLENRK